ncbi:MAG: FtsH protease activity modulator HflK [Rhodospirillales bacterium]|nr:FtsH protease activity modulator HflK [Rhodospirillales bacterium]
MPFHDDDLHGPARGPSENGSGGPSGPWGMPGGGNRRPGGPQGPQGPWGGGGGGRGPGGTPPDLDDLIARAQAFIRGLMPGRGGGGGKGGGGGAGGFSGGRGAALLGLVLVGIWLASGFYNVQPDELGVVMRFGAYNRRTDPGLNYHLPWPIESVLRPAVTRINRVEIGYRSAGADGGAGGGASAAQDVPRESLMLTGDENIIDINFAVFWRISDPAAFLFNTRHPAETVKAVAESVMREVIGRTPIQPALTDARARIEADVTKGVQAIMNQYGSGVEITQVQLQRVDPPAAVIESFRDVQRANTDADRMRNEAETYHNDIVPRARGEAARLVAEAEGAKQSSIAEATGQSERFLSVLKAYEAAKDVTLQRLYIETMQDILTHTPAVIVSDKLRGVAPYLPLPGLTALPPAPAPVKGATP